MKRWIIFSSLSLLLLLSIFLGLLGWIVSTEGGLRFLTKTAQQFAPGTLNIDTVEGILLEEFRLDGLSYQHDGTAVQVDSFQFAWNAKELLDRKLHIEKLHINGIQADLPKSEEAEPEKESAPIEIPDISLPVQVVLDDVQISQVAIRTAEAEPFIIDRLELRSTTTDVWSLQHLQIKSPLLNGKLAGDVGLTKPHTVQLNLDWSAQLPDFTVVGQGELTGDMQKLILTHTVSEPLEIELESTVEDILGALSMDTRLTWQEIYWPFNPEVAKDYLVHSQQGRVTLSGTLDNYQFDLKANVSGQQIPAGQWSLSAQGNQQQLLINQLRSELLKGVMTATGQLSWQPKLAGQINLNVDDITIKEFWNDWPEELRLDSQLVAQLDDDQFQIKQFNVTLPQTSAKLSLTGKGEVAGDKSRLQTATLTWQGVQWPLVGDNTLVTSERGWVNLSGALQNYQVDLDTQVATAEIPSGHLVLKGQGNLEQFTIKSLRSHLLEGAVKATGKVSWQPELAAQINLNAKALNIKNFWKDWPDALTVNSNLVAELKDKAFKTTLKVTLPNTAAQLSVQGQGSLTDDGPRFKNTVLAWQGLQWPLVGKQSQVNSQRGRVNFSGTLQNYQVDLETLVAIPQMPASRLALKGQGNLQQFTIKSLSSNLLKGSVNATGQVSWQPKLVAKLNLNANQLTIKDFWKDWPNQLRINSNLTAKLNGDTFKTTLKVAIPKTAAQLSFNGQGRLRDDGPSFKNTVLAWKGLQWPLVGKEPMINSQKGRVNLSGTLQNYRVDLETQLASPQISASRLALKGQGNLQQFTIKSLRSRLLKGNVNASGNVSWQPNLAAQIKLDANHLSIKQFWPDWPDQLTINSSVRASLDGDTFKINQFKVKVPQTAAQLSVQGDGSLAGNEPSFNATLAWNGLQWPLIGDPVLVSSKTGQLKAKGTAEAYQLRLNADIQGADIPKGRWQAIGNGDTSSLQLQTLQGQILQGTLDLTGKVRWLPDVSWQLALKGNNINPGSQWTEWPGKLALNIQSQGLLKNGALQTQVQIQQVGGRLRDYPLQLETEQVAVTIPPNPPLSKTRNRQSPAMEIAIKNFAFESGRNYLKLNGQLGQDSQLDWEINAPDIAALLPDGKGRLTGKGRLSGPLEWPHIKAQLEGHGLAFQQNSLKQLTADIDVNLLSQNNLRLDVVATDLAVGATPIQKISLKGQGRVTNHTLVASVTLPKDRLSVQLRGGFKQPRWQGHLQQLTASTDLVGYWQLEAPAALSLSATEAKLARSCLKNTRTSLFCTQLNWQKMADSQLRVWLKSLPLNLIRSVLPEDSDLTGTVDGWVTASLAPDGAIDSDVTIELSPGALRTHFSEYAVEELTHKGGKLQLNINRKGLAADLKLSLLKQSGLQGSFKMPRFTHLPPQGEQPMQGYLKATFADLGILSTFVPQVENSQGQVDMALKVGGTLTVPKIEGQLNVQKAAADLPDFGLELRNLNATIHDEGPNRLKMQASLNSGAEGELKINGTAQLVSATDWRAKVKITGKDFEVYNMPEAWVLTSFEPINISIVPDRIEVTGKVTIPEAMITPLNAASGAVTVSEDVVIVNPRNPVPVEPTEKQSAMAISTKVEVNLGDQVSFEAAGFKSRFGGQLVASNQPGKVTVGNGELYIIDGSYKAYGQDLKIDRGRVFFSGGPIENPGLDIQAYRDIKRGAYDKVIAGVHIQGSAQSPEIGLFSRPMYDQSNILSYILLGKPASQATQGEGNMLLSAAASLPFKGGDSLVNKLGKDFGLDEAGISTDDGIEQAALVLGKYLTPGLYVSYGIGLFDGSSVLRMRYELTDNLTIETETGSQSGVDLRYTLER